MHSCRENKISKKEFIKLKEDKVMFITNPGRMGDEDGTTFVVNDGNEYIVYRIDGWMYPTSTNGEDKISMEDVAKQFPKWYETWKHGLDDNYSGKYKYLYMGFGNGLCIDNSIYEEYEPYLDRAVKKNLEKYKGHEKEEMKYAAIFSVWEEALVNMVEDK